jgi:hypothetical protein
MAWVTNGSTSFRITFIIIGLGLIAYKSRTENVLVAQIAREDAPASDRQLITGQIEIEFDAQFFQTNVEAQGTQFRGNRTTYWAVVHNGWHNDINGACAFIDRIELCPPTHSPKMKSELIQMNAYIPLMRKDTPSSNLDIPSGGRESIILASYNDASETVSIGNVRFTHHPDNIHRLFVSVFFNGRTVLEKRFITWINKTSLGKKFMVSVDASDY